MPFLRELYGQLSGHPSLKLATLGDCVVQLPAEPLPPVRAGSWVHGQLLTWIGFPTPRIRSDQYLGAFARIGVLLAAGRPVGRCDWAWRCVGFRRYVRGCA